MNLERMEHHGNPNPNLFSNFFLKVNFQQHFSALASIVISSRVQHSVFIQPKTSTKQDQRGTRQNFLPSRLNQNLFIANYPRPYIFIYFFLLLCIFISRYRKYTGGEIRGRGRKKHYPQLPGGDRTLASGQPGLANHADHCRASERGTGNYQSESEYIMH